MCFDYSLLNGKIVEKYGNRYAFAYDLGISERSLSLKLNNKVGWKQLEMEKTCKLLSIPIKDLSVYFFNRKVQYNWTN